VGGTTELSLIVTKRGAPTVSTRCTSTLPNHIVSCVRYVLGGAESEDPRESADVARQLFDPKGGVLLPHIPQNAGQELKIKTKWSSVSPRTL